MRAANAVRARRRDGKLKEGVLFGGAKKERQWMLAAT
jgi:hypothetical protein